MQFLHLEVSVGSPFLQVVDKLLVITIGSYGIVVKCRQPPLGNEPLH